MSIEPVLLPLPVPSCFLGEDPDLTRIAHGHIPRLASLETRMIPSIPSLLLTEDPSINGFAHGIT